MGDINAHLERFAAADYARQRNYAAVKEREPRGRTQPATIVPIRYLAIERRRQSPKLMTNLFVQLWHTNADQSGEIHILDCSGTVNTNHQSRDRSDRLWATHASHVAFRAVSIRADIFEFVGQLCTCGNATLMNRHKLTLLSYIGIRS